jgi:benzoate membrane transport protein
MSGDLRAPLLAGTVASVTGTAASIGVVLTALNSLGASPGQTATAVAVMLLSYGFLSIVLSARFRQPISIVWSTPGAALLVSSGTLGLGFANAAGAFLVTGLLLTLTGLWPALGKLVGSIPKPIAAAMLAGVIFPFCVAPFAALAEYSSIVLAPLVVWAVLFRFARVWSAPVAIALFFGLIAWMRPTELHFAQLLPTFELVIPEFSLVAVLGIAIPLYLVTMASQNVPGIAIMKSFDYEVPFKPVLVSTGLVTSIGSFFGGFALNLAAITAALNANEQAHKEPSKRWLASVFGGGLYILLAFAVAPLVEFVLGAPRVLILAAAGIALFSTMAISLTTAIEVPHLALPAVVTFLIGASGFAAFGIGPGFWALVGGILLWQVFEYKKRAQSTL